MAVRTRSGIRQLTYEAFNVVQQWMFNSRDAIYARFAALRDAEHALYATIFDENRWLQRLTAELITTQSQNAQEWWALAQRGLMFNFRQVQHNQLVERRRVAEKDLKVSGKRHKYAERYTESALRTAYPRYKF